jgi:Reverse transcriptase (RNA-dependent DNA polymerase)
LEFFPYVKEGWGHWSDKPTSEKKQICLEIPKGKALTPPGCYASICFVVFWCFHGNFQNQIQCSWVGWHIPIKFLRILINPLLQHITHIFNSSIVSAQFPTAWKNSKIIPIAKVADPEDYRPISILPALSKALEMLMRHQMVDFLESTNAVDFFQSGFRTGHSTATALLCVTDDIYKNLDEGMFAMLVLLDFSKAFDTVNLGKSWTSLQ